MFLFYRLLYPLCSLKNECNLVFLLFSRAALVFIKKKFLDFCNTIFFKIPIPFLCSYFPPKNGKYHLCSYPVMFLLFLLLYPFLKKLGSYKRNQCNLIPFMFLTGYVLISSILIPFMFLKIYVLIKNECNLVFLLFCPSRACVYQNPFSFACMSVCGCVLYMCNTNYFNPKTLFMVSSYYLDFYTLYVLKKLCSNKK